MRRGQESQRQDRLSFHRSGSQNPELEGPNNLFEPEAKSGVFQDLFISSVTEQMADRTVCQGCVQSAGNISRCHFVKCCSGVKINPY